MALTPPPPWSAYWPSGVTKESFKDISGSYGSEYPFLAVASPSAYEAFVNAATKIPTSDAAKLSKIFGGPEKYKAAADAYNLANLNYRAQLRPDNVNAQLRLEREVEDQLQSAIASEQKNLPVAKSSAQVIRDQNYKTIRNELEQQYNNLVKLAPEAAYRGRASDLPAIFNQQAAQLADAGVTSILNLRNQNGRLVDISTGQNFTNTNLGGQIAVDRDTGATKWGDIFSGVEGGANYGISFDKEGKPIMYPVYEKSKSLAAQVFGSDLFKLVSLGLTLYGVYNLATALTSAGGVATASAAASTAAEAVGSEAAKTVATEAVKEAGKTAVEKALTDMAINAGIGGVIFEAAGGDFLTGAVVGALGSVGSTTYAESVGKAIVPSATAAAQVTVGNAVINSGLSGLVASATGGDVTKSMLAGAAKGASIASSKTIAEALAGKENIAAIVNATNLTTSQVENLITSAATNGMIAEISGQGNFAEVALNTLVSGGVGASVANGVVNNLNLDKAEEKGIFAATRNLASAATSAAIQGQDIGDALEMAAPGAILSGYQAYDQQIYREEEAALREKELAALQQPLQVAGPTPSFGGPLESALQQAIDRGERIVNQGSYIDPDSGQRVITYTIEGYSRGDINSLDPNEIYDPSLFYKYTVNYDPELGVDYQWNGQQDGNVVIVASKLPPTFNESAGGLVKAEQAAQFAPTEQPDRGGAGLSEELRQSTLDLLIQNELARLENELAGATQTQRAFEGARGQFERLSELPAGTIEEDLQGQLEQELADLERQATEGQGRIAEIERERGAIEGIGTEGGRTLSDEELLGYLETGKLPQGLLGGQPEGEGTAPEGGLKAGEGGEGTGAGGEGEGEGGEEEVTTEPTTVTTPLSPTVLFSQELPARPETTPFSSRVTGEALEGILGEKEPLFGGDEDEQRAVWNRRSLRLLSRALGL